LIAKSRELLSDVNIRLLTGLHTKVLLEFRNVPVDKEILIKLI